MRDTGLFHGCRARALPYIASLSLGIVGLGGCSIIDDALDVQAPSRVEGKDLENPEVADLLTASALSSFVCAFGHYTVSGGLLGDELVDADLSSNDDDIDSRRVNASSPGTANNCGSSDFIPGPYLPLAGARYQADNTLRLLNSWTDEQVAGRLNFIVTAAAYGGYAYLLIGEGWCSATFDIGPEETRAQVLQRAIARFDQAIAGAQTSSNGTMLALARIGRARALLDLGQKSQARTEAQLVGPNVNVQATYSSDAGRVQNLIWLRNIRPAPQYAIGPVYRNMMFAGVPDSRVRVTLSSAKASNPTVPLWVQSKYSDDSSPISIARSAEAQLIIAEVDGGQAAVAIINALHAKAGLPPFASTNPTEIQSQIVYERRAEFFLESQHLGDYNRYALPFDPAPGQPFFFGGVYGNARCFPLPDVERLNNPNVN